MKEVFLYSEILPEKAGLQADNTEHSTKLKFILVYKLSWKN